MTKPKFDLPKEQIAAFCRRWGIRELALFGSVLRDDFKPDSDLDVLVTFASGTDWSLLDHVRMEQELAELLGRKIDVLSTCPKTTSFSGRFSPQIQSQVGKLFFPKGDLQVDKYSAGERLSRATTRYVAGRY